MILRRIIYFFAIFGVLVAPWTRLDGVYCAWFRMLGRATLSWGHSGRDIRFEVIQRTQFRPLDTRIALADERQRVLFLDLDMRGIGWVPTAFLAALVLATPVPWARRGRALFFGVGAMQAFVLISIGVHILDYSGARGGAVMDGLDETLVNQIGAGFFASVFVWIIVTFRLEDLTALIRRRVAQPAIERQCVTPR